MFVFVCDVEGGRTKRNMREGIRVQERLENWEERSKRRQENTRQRKD